MPDPLAYQCTGSLESRENGQSGWVPQRRDLSGNVDDPSDFSGSGLTGIPSRQPPGFSSGLSGFPKVAHLVFLVVVPGFPKQWSPWLTWQRPLRISRFTQMSRPSRWRPINGSPYGPHSCLGPPSPAGLLSAQGPTGGSIWKQGIALMIQSVL